MLASFHEKGNIEVGTDEAGRGCLAGPVVAAAVILPPDFRHELLDDSKKLTEKKRDFLRPIIEKEALAYGVSIVSPKEIDEINILQASLLGMHRSIDQLEIPFDSILVDGNKFNPYKEIPHHCMIKGDGRFLSIAAASILAKTYRDEYMYKIAQEFPDYDWAGNKGYPTKKHRAAIAKHGANKYHRMTFKLLPDTE